MNENERILLDAEIVGVISKKAFRARLRNGHIVVAFVVGPREQWPAWAPGDRVQLELTPFDMTKGRICGPAAGEKMS